ncbi:hypothetical protein EAF04_003588 [Stromatinia cepivora]|nr:hypothetical protein EAF04_003588 [Stromatinia cepivora]
MLTSSYPIILFRTSGRAWFVFCHNPCTPSSYTTNQQRSFRPYTRNVYQAVCNKRKVIPEKKDPNEEEYSFKKLEEALANSRKTNSPGVHAISRFQLVWHFHKDWNAPSPPTGKTHYKGREFLGPHTPEVKRARKIAERLFLVLPDGHIFRHVEVIKNPGGSNAFATSDGVVILDQGILNFTYTDDLLDYLIAHEMAHHLLQHNKQKNVGRKWCNTLFALQAFFTDLMSFRSANLATMAHLQHLKNFKLSRRFELEADEEGMMIMWKANYKPSALNSWKTR